MPPKLRSDDGRNVVIRPLTYCREKDLIKYAEHKEFPIIPCNLCGSQENLQRQSIKAMLIDWDKKTPGRVEAIFKSIQNVSPSQLADRELFDFVNLPLDREGSREEYEFSEATVSSTNIDESMFIDVTNV
jgi:tRNA 2-thiocytidine biosynthesis protein TtcA